MYNKAFSTICKFLEEVYALKCFGCKTCLVSIPTVNVCKHIVLYICPPIMAWAEILICLFHMFTFPTQIVDAIFIMVGKLNTMESL